MATAAKQAMHKRGEMVERSFAHILDRGGLRRAWLRGLANIHKRYWMHPMHVPGFNLGILMRAMFGKGTSREVASARAFSGLTESRQIPFGLRS